MRLSELLGRELRDVDDRSIGRVHDIRLVQDGPLQGFDAAFRVHGVIAGPGSLAVRLGYGRAGIRGPWLVRALLERRRVVYVPWDDLELDGEVLRCRCRSDQLSPPAALTDAPTGAVP